MTTVDAPRVETKPLLDEPAPTSAMVILVIGVVVPFLALLAAVPIAWGRGLSWLDIVLAIVFYFVSGFGVTVGFHRYFTHGAFKAARWLRVTLAVAGSLSLEGPLIQWVADHRRHHAYADREGDPRRGLYRPAVQLAAALGVRSRREKEVSRKHPHRRALPLGLVAVERDAVPARLRVQAPAQVRHREGIAVAHHRGDRPADDRADKSDRDGQPGRHRVGPGHGEPGEGSRDEGRDHDGDHRSEHEISVTRRVELTQGLTRGQAPSSDRWGHG